MFAPSSVRGACLALDAFISYSERDKTVADAVCAKLEAGGIRCWIAPRDVTPGLDWGAEIIDAINGSRVMVLVYSSNANQSSQIKREVERAVHKGIPIIPFRIEDVPMSKALEYFISSPHWLDALTPPLERHLEYLTRTIALLLSRTGPDAQPASSPPTASGAEPPPRPIPGVAAGFGTQQGAPSLAPSPATFAAPTVSSGSARIRRRTAVAAAAIACLVVAGGYYALTPKARVASSNGVIDQPSAPPVDVPEPRTPASHPTPRRTSEGHPPRAAVPESRSLNAAPSVVPNPPPSAVVDPGLVGTWSFTHDDRAGHTLSRFTIDNRGAYSMRVTVTDDGSVTANGGQFLMVSRNQNTIQGTYAPISATSSAVTTAAGTVIWSRRPGAPLPEGPQSFAGTWEATPIVNGLTWHQTVEINGGQYRLMSETQEAGQFTAANGAWHTMSRGGRALGGTYQLLGRETLSFNGPLGQSTWTRN